MSQRIVFATGNCGKIREIGQLFSGLDYEIVPQSEFNVPEADETGLTFVENALIKARSAAQLTGLPAIADDSGLEVDALNGAPGIYSARYAGADATDRDNLDKLLIDMASVEDGQRSARFHCALVYLQHATDPTPIIRQGSWEGEILRTPHGEGGFGYDPIFHLVTHNCTSAELPAELKNQLSHRGQALRKLLAAMPQ